MLNKDITHTSNKDKLLLGRTKDRKTFNYVTESDKTKLHLNVIMLSVITLDITVKDIQKHQRGIDAPI